MHALKSLIVYLQWYIQNCICVSHFKLTKNVITILAVGADEVESLKSALGEAQKEAEASKAVADKAIENLEEEQTTRR